MIRWSVKNRLQLLGVLFLFLWTLFTLYPQPTNLVKSVYRLINLPINPYAEEIVSLIERCGSEDPVIIEKFVKAEIPYQYDWETYNMPWYFPTVKEVFEKGAGDCKGRAVVIASIFESYNKEYAMSASPSHIWIHYPEKKETLAENKDAALFSHEEKLELQIPKINWSNSYKTIKEGFWDYMPENKKIMLSVGFQFFVIVNYIALFYDIIRVRFHPYFFK